ncbi:alpha/beta hydrolase fold domain-containing protein [Thermopolyspora sp. NPDC052614]|uniref:alpha/beta hydrolase fold domain-containing protein n=1 Tax=Thermopolyspora sp. NPDC052614 TaxID=3155682 RepID=UPI00343110D6
MGDDQQYAKRADAEPPASVLAVPPLPDARRPPPGAVKLRARLRGCLRRLDIELAWSAVLGEKSGTDDVHPYSAPGRATNLTNLPDTFIAVAQFDVLRDEGIDFARRLLAANVPVNLHLYARAFHAWDRFAAASALSRSFGQTWHTFLRRNLHD